MNTYVVHLDIQCGEYEKSTVVLVEANSEAPARKIAIEGEAHDELEWEDGGAYDLNRTFHYSINTIQLVDTADVETLRKYL